MTQWSLIQGVARSADEPCRRLLGHLLSRYWPALQAHLILRRRLKPEAAEDLLQGFVADKVVEQNLLSQADRGRGKFRTFLCTALDHYLVSQMRKANARKRAPDGGLADLGAVAEPIGAEADPGQAFDVAWARAMLGEALKQMEAECSRVGRPQWWELFRERVLKPTLEGGEPTAYEELVVRLKLESAVQASNLLVTVKRTFARVLRAVVAEYAGEDEVEEELRDLKAALARA